MVALGVQVTIKLKVRYSSPECCKFETFDFVANFNRILMIMDGWMDGWINSPPLVRVIGALGRAPLDYIDNGCALLLAPVSSHSKKSL